MTSVHSKYLDVFVAKQVKNAATTSNVFMTFGKSSAWTDELDPPQANTSMSAFNETWKNMIGAKRVTGNNIRNAIPKIGRAHV